MTDREKDPQNAAVEIGKTIALSLILAFGIRSFIAEARFIPSESMLPTLEVHDRLIIEKVSYHLKKPERGDIIVFMPPEAAINCDPKQQLPLKDAYIKRVVGLPGEQVQVRNGRVYINDELLEENYTYTEPDDRSSPLPPIAAIVPKKSYLVLGDNRNASCDSRIWGFVPEDNIIGRAVVRFWPFNRVNVGL
ncbi:signal peptidase I [Lusitaniella coriacea LEGE 07157]|uniref:Signal peptidase I n=1 Tax=Lusitaniella coriacea LEGE 07157 TaxID=945747 RepID=A0A8J7DLF9_9CYAN|nr:signal peptidase I [Lusitaniella coriacea]MBE9114983.1 signal peptidase I [Lusitaniella coriacea LEGE 07157]